MTMTSPVLLTLIDQRLPSGGHIHSGGIEEAVAEGLVVDVASLGEFLAMRIQTAGLVSAAMAAAAVSLTAERYPLLDMEMDARLPSLTSRALSRAQGRGLLRVAKAAWAAPSAQLTWREVGERPHLPILLGCVARAAGLASADAAMAMAYLSVTGPATAAQRLLSLDPISVAVATIGMSDVIAEVANRADVAAQGEFRDLPDLASVQLDLMVERHAARPNRLFAS